MRRCVGIAVILVGTSAFAHADDRTEYHFGFLTGTTVGEVGEKEAQYRMTHRFGKRTGTYNVLSHKLEAEFVPAQNFGLSVGSYFTHHRIAGIPELDDRRSGRFDGASLGLKYQLLDRAHAPFGLAIEAEPQWRRADGTSGEPVNEYGGQYWLMLDKELVPNRALAVFNLVYEPEASQSRITGAWSHEIDAALRWRDNGRGRLPCFRRCGKSLSADLRGIGARSAFRACTLSRADGVCKILERILVLGCLEHPGRRPIGRRGWFA